MKLIISLICMLFVIEAHALCLSPLSRTNINSGQIPTSLKYNSDFNDLYDRINNFPGDCIADNSIKTAAFEDDVFTTDMITNATVTASNFASGVVPVMGKLLRIRAYTATGSLKKSPDMTAVLVHVVGGGGATSSTNASNGGTSSFGSHCSASGGAKAVNNAANVRSLGGFGTNGNINLSGGLGDRPHLNPSSKGGVSMFGTFGKGGEDIQGNGGGGAGGYCMKLILAADIEDTVTITVGSGGTNLSGNGTNGKGGIVIVYEYGN